MSAFLCPVCNSSVDPKNPTLPFCSERCRQIDLGRWLGERYSVPLPQRRSPDECEAEQDESGE